MPNILDMYGPEAGATTVQPPQLNPITQPQQQPQQQMAPQQPQQQQPAPVPNPPPNTSLSGAEAILDRYGRDIAPSREQEMEHDYMSLKSQPQSKLEKATRTATAFGSPTVPFAAGQAVGVYDFMTTSIPQLLNQGLEAVGLREKGSTKDKTVGYNQQREKEQQGLDKYFPKPGLTKTGRFVGEQTPLLMVPGAGGLLSGAVQGAIGGATTYDPTGGDNRKVNTVLGGVAGGAAGWLFGKGLPTIKAEAQQVVKPQQLETAVRDAVSSIDDIALGKNPTTEQVLKAKAAFENVISMKQQQASAFWKAGSAEINKAVGNKPVVGNTNLIDKLNDIKTQYTGGDFANTEYATKIKDSLDNTINYLTRNPKSTIDEFNNTIKVMNAAARGKGAIPYLSTLPAEAQKSVAKGLLQAKWSDFDAISGVSDDASSMMRKLRSDYGNMMAGIDTIKKGAVARVFKDANTNLGTQLYKNLGNMTNDQTKFLMDTIREVDPQTADAIGGAYLKQALKASGGGMPGSGVGDYNLPKLWKFLGDSEKLQTIVGPEKAKIVQNNISEIFKIKNSSPEAGSVLLKVIGGAADKLDIIKNLMTPGVAAKTLKVLQHVPTQAPSAAVGSALPAHFQPNQQQGAMNGQI